MRKLGPLVLAIAAVAGPISAHAANWLQLQGTEPEESNDAIRPWGFVQMEYQGTKGSTIPAGAWAGQPMMANQIGPDSTSNSTFAIRRARTGLRGVFADSPRVNYLIAGEFGDNGATYYGNGSAHLIDASMTVNLMPELRIRSGLFKHPTGEEALATAYIRDYINLTNATAQLVRETYFDSDGSDPTSANLPNGPQSTFHDTGVQLFGIVSGKWEHTYAVMVGNGNGLGRSDNNSNKDLYLYWASERVEGGKGGYRHGWKLFAWNQSGKRTLADGSEYDRLRSGAGTTYRQADYHIAAEYIAAKGMIPSGTDGGALPGAENNAGTAVASYNLLPRDHADGWYVDAGYRIHPKWELDIRYDILNRGTDTATGKRVFTTITAGTQYLVNKTTRLMANYEIRKADAPGLAQDSVTNQILDKIDNRFSLQLQVVFK